MKTVENTIMTITTIGVLSMVFRLLLHIGMNDISVWYHWVYFTVACAMCTFVSYVIGNLIYQGWKQS